MTTIWTERTMLVPPAYVTLARNLAAGLDPVAGKGMFTTPLQDAAGTIRYYISSGLIGEQFAAVLEDPALLYAACQKAGAAVTLAVCQSMLAACVISNGALTTVIGGMPTTVREGPHALIARLGLQMMRGTI